MLRLIEPSVREEGGGISNSGGYRFYIHARIRKEEKLYVKIVQFVQRLYNKLDGVTQWQTTRMFVLTQRTDARKIGHGRAEKRVGSVRNVTQ